MLLEELGWRLVGGRQGLYNRLAPPNLADETGLRGSLVIPLDREAPEFAELLSAAVLEVSSSATQELWQRLIEPRIIADPADQFQFRKETSAPAGLIPWKLGEDLIKSARATLAAGAKTYVQKMRRYSNRLGQFSGRFLDTVMMGQTAAGSYIVTAYAPTDASIPVFSTTPPGAGAYGGRVARGREVTSAVAGALGATAEALDHYRRTASLSGFEFGIRSGISFELSAALYELARDSDGGDIQISWEESVDLLEAPFITSFEFSGSDAPILQRAATFLSGDAEEVTRRRTLVGRVHLLTKKQMGGPGLFGIETLSGLPRKVRVRLRDMEDYHRAVRAHDEDLVLAVEGELERDGSMNWLYNAEILAEIGQANEISTRLAAMPRMEQISVDDFFDLDDAEDQGLDGEAQQGPSVS
ncbi:hypothetical protein [Micromonospora sp. WMMD998]|uniref:hypothetical protein n=1 Tax=Micromonospora sp. WMMD998 TaxID=3016092 RepID=UPI00249A4709|nr:hypothetical protein [Micromonospora sp. WMMD998]WFE37437.1 hypothetical protein O7619_02900 [Micromonospora sp. WMMD998]